MDRVAALKRTLRHFIRTTTLHGFKYLWSQYFIDRIAQGAVHLSTYMWSEELQSIMNLESLNRLRSQVERSREVCCEMITSPRKELAMRSLLCSIIGWVVVCAASTCCAGVLCAVLWARFLEMPALLELQHVSVYDKVIANMPLLAVCPPVLTVAQHLNMSASNATRLARSLSSVLVGRGAAKDQLKILEKLLSDQNTTLTDMLLKYSPTCTDLIVTCRWQSVTVPCKALFKKELWTGSVCCIMQPAKAIKSLDESVRPSSLYRRIKTIDLALQCSNETVFGCKFYAKYDDETNVEPLVLAPGYTYTAQMSFNSVPMSSTEEFFESNCVANKRYSREKCQEKCAENHCGCSDPLRQIIRIEKGNKLPKCSIKQLACLRTYDERDNDTCVCLPSCNKVTSDISLESTRFNPDIFSIDPIYTGLNSKSTVVHFQLNLHSSKIFSLNPTETWLTLLSSLGGVFNMFLGVGLFSALEIVCLLIFKLPSILLKSRIQ